jgi:hypothetical protein
MKNQIPFMQRNVTFWNKTVITFHNNDMSHVLLILNECKWHNSIKFFITKKIHCVFLYYICLHMWTACACPTHSNLIPIKDVKFYNNPFMT